MKQKIFAFTLASVLALSVVPSAMAAPVLKVGGTPTGVPFTFLDTKTNTIDGVMVDIIKAVGKEAGFEVQMEPMSFSALIGSLTSKRIDVISAPMFITAKRQEVISFSQPVYSYGEGVMLPKTETKNYASFADMKGLAVGVGVGTAFVEPVQKSGLFSDVKLYDSAPDMMRDVNIGRIQAGFMDSPIASYIIGQGNYPNLRLDPTYKAVMVGNLGIGVRKDDPEMLAKINTAITAMKANGTLATILKKWGLTAP